MKIAALFSGGKDSTLALYEAIKDAHDIVCLVSVIPRNPESYMFHYPNIGLVKHQARAMQTPIITKETKGEKEKELRDMEKALLEAKNKYGAEGVVVGAIESEYQNSRVSKVCRPLGLKVVAPLWHRKPEELWGQLLDCRFRVIITAVACEGMDESWLGREIDHKALDRLLALSKKHRFHPSGEGGEFETFVKDGPLFKYDIMVKKARKVWEYNSGMYVIEEVKLEEK